MQTASATDVKNRFGEYLEICREEPVVVQRTGRDVAVLISRSEFDRFTAMEDQYWGMRAAEAEKTAIYLGHEESMAFIQNRLREIGEPI